ncbi:hypothetical protein CONCODRAFT_79143 [Conidiobolus coronatus NRRL 28638]|uniref:Mid2 domain-containing protein n=1 Tax=Conidiobolus coronatus (strain ATCC 28846 / CBS 209.66 / NRRL 28638) TaxID=796925 RepID=A0A137P453_CONC2|nr:hypothetical protein CONCODRAFT_79143 [Conidiobolus coronatus NRRL 28638]|eukprot:KXN69786.1 hypothetical protein CONCODRAFT_79143 [Conidiobolus coronatus NRRL 28638]
MKAGYCKFINSLLLAGIWLSYTALACPPGYADCPYFGCTPGQCPQSCNSITNEGMCSNTGNGDKRCKWFNTYCGQDITCMPAVNGCSPGCMVCGSFGCMPEGSNGCPQRCDLYALEIQCNGSPVYGSNTCRWAGDKCAPAIFTPPSTNATNPEKDTPSPTHTSETEEESPTSTETNSQTSATSTNTSSRPSATSSSPTSSSSGMPGAAENSTVNINTTDSGYIGMIVGIVLGVIGLIGIIVVLVHRYRQKVRAQTNEDFGYRTTGTTPLLDRPNSFLHALKSIMDNDINLTKMRTPTTMTSPQ